MIKYEHLKMHQSTLENLFEFELTSDKSLKKIWVYEDFLDGKSFEHIYDHYGITADQTKEIIIELNQQISNEPWI